MEWLTSNGAQIIELIVQIVGVASLVATLTPNESDNKAVDFILNIINMLGANIGRAKNNQVVCCAAEQHTKNPRGLFLDLWGSYFMGYVIMDHLKIMQTLQKNAEDLNKNMNRTGARHAAAIVYKNQIVAYGVNQNKSHPFHSRFSEHDDAIFLHAETDAIKNALRRISENELEKASLYVCRHFQTKKGYVHTTGT